jgi:formamidopyrimidine-DNA glycosylase
MFEIPEYQTIAKQMTESMTGKRIAEGRLGNSPHKFVWYNQKPREFSAKVKGKTVGTASTRGRWLFVPLEKGYVLVFGECGGRIQLHPSESHFPDRYHLLLVFEDGSGLSAVTRMWGAMELYEKGKEQQRKYICGMRTTPTEAGFSPKYLVELAKEAIANGNRTVKAILTQDQLIPGLGNAIAQDIMFNARLHPKQLLENLDAGDLITLHRSIVKTLKGAIRLGGRNDEYDLHGNAGRYVRLMDKNAVGRPCPNCGTRIEKIAYLGGACYVCTTCQRFKA